MAGFVGAIDCGTTRTKAGIVSLRGQVRGLAEHPSPCSRGADGRVGTDALGLAHAGFSALREGLRRSRLRPSAVEALAVTNQRATLVCVDARGAPLGEAISWQDMRGAAAIERLRKRFPEARYRAITGLPNNPVFTLGKILWLQEGEPGRFRRTARFALVQDFLLRRLGAADHFLDWSNASLTGLLDVERLTWSDDILSLCGLPADRLPHLVPPGHPVGRLSRAAARSTGLLEGTPLVAGGGDQQCAAIGSGVVRPGVVGVTLGTAAAPLCTANRPPRDRRGRIACCAHAVPGKWEAEGLQNCAGSCLRWLAAAGGGRPRFSDRLLREAGRLPPGAGGVVFLPHLAGASAPHWSPDARGAFLGLGLAHGRAHLLRAVLEGVAMQTREIMDVFTALGLPVRDVRLTGGCAGIEAWTRLQADLYGMPVTTLATPEATLLGAALLAACGAGAFASVPEAADRMVRVRRVFAPDPGRAAAFERLYRRFLDVQQDLLESAALGRPATPE